ncbi:uncharacterized protein E5676_scaffold2406G00190 [Cucumis melo var. makuwa]|uniref:Uncharacterized protein n=1 Tax=Cucumis melo var. makuwa TaxID=1194695 RepID=A0A5D3DYC4_CUCMM|nr:uncharacterized protein E6C27_scaffold35G00900 [Cucumis melo var. makuwa]TYK28897.1 uncharacterized protein E5676_scaffold2406G00190 [Cucumis melo var. makuwa]
MPCYDVMLCYMLWMGVLLTLSIRVVPTWVSLEITTFSMPDCLSVSFGYTKDQFVLGVPLGSPKTRYVPAGSQIARVWEHTSSGVLLYRTLMGSKGKGRGKLASDREGSVACHMRTQFCFRVYEFMALAFPTEACSSASVQSISVATATTTVVPRAHPVSASTVVTLPFLRSSLCLPPPSVVLFFDHVRVQPSPPSLHVRICLTGSNLVCLWLDMLQERRLAVIRKSVLLPYGTPASVATAARLNQRQG